MFDKEKLIPDHCPPIDRDVDILSIKKLLDQDRMATPSAFISLFEQRLGQYQSLDLKGLETFKHKDVIVGCTQFIKDLIFEHGLENIQLFQHGYHYYKTLDPLKEYTTLGTLTNEKILLLELPFPGHLGPRRDINDIIAKCNDQGIDLHLDCAWLTCGMDIYFDFDQPCIKSVGMSLSKCYGLGWSKIGVRWSRKKQAEKIVPNSNLQIGMTYLDEMPMDHLVRKYRATYQKLCREFYLRPSNVIIGAHSMDMSRIFGLRDCLLSLS